MTRASLLNTSWPIIQAPMAGSQGSALAVAVCHAGGLGSLPCAVLSPDAMRTELTRLTAGTTAPYNVNFFCHTSPRPDPERERRWREQLAPYYREFGVDAPPLPQGVSRAPFDHDAALIVEEFRPAVVSFHFGLPDADLLRRVKATGATVLSSATTVEEAVWLERHGADAIVAQGLEAGGHRGSFLGASADAPQLGALDLLVAIVRTVSVPVVAAGGIADASAVKAALSAGAAAVQVGTAYLLTHEATTSAVHRQALAADGARQTAVTNLFTGRPARGLVNRLMRELGPLRPDVPAFPLATAAVAPLRAAAEARGSGDFSPLWAGQSSVRCAPIAAGALTRALVGA